MVNDLEHRTPITAHPRIFLFRGCWGSWGKWGKALGGMKRRPENGQVPAVEWQLDDQRSELPARRTIGVSLLVSAVRPAASKASDPFPAFSMAMLCTNGQVV